MTVTDHERPRAKPKPKGPPRPATVRAPASPIYVPPVPERRSKLRPTLLCLAALGLVGGLAIVPWGDLPGGGAEWRQAFLDVGVPRQYRDLMTQGEAALEAPVAPETVRDDPSLTALLGRRPPPLDAAASAAPAAEPAAAPPSIIQQVQPKLFVARVEPPAPAPTKPAPLPPAPKPAVTAEAPSAAAPGYRVQIAATGSDAEAKAAWRDVQRAFPEETSGRVLSVRLAEVKGRVVRRALVTGFPSSEAAKAFCARLAAADRGCILRGKEG